MSAPPGLSASNASFSMAPQTAFRAAFVAKCHRLLALGYQTLDGASLQAAQETVITGLLVQAINHLIESPDAPQWMEPFVANDDPPQNTASRLGKRRRRIDIEMVQIQRGKRPRFLFEAKRLSARASLHAYLGKDGLNLYARGEYAAEHTDAGMLGYVQASDPASWASELMKSLSKNPLKHCLDKQGDLVAHQVVTELPFTYQSRHSRKTIGVPITVIHTLLSFC